MNHTKEPWVVERTGKAYHRILAADGRPVAANVGGGHENPLTPEELEANARRIAACVNACAGIPTERLESLKVPLMKHLFGCDEHAANLVKQRDELLAAIEQARYRIRAIGVVGAHDGKETILRESAIEMFERAVEGGTQ